MATFHVEGKVELIVLTNNFRILHAIEKCLCVMFGFHLGIVDVSKDKTYDDNNNVIRSIYQVPILGDFGLEWRVNVATLALGSQPRQGFAKMRAKRRARECGRV
jgi:hypothetical protein